MSEESVVFYLRSISRDELCNLEVMKNVMKKYKVKQFENTSMAFGDNALVPCLRFILSFLLQCHSVDTKQPASQEGI